MSTQAVKIRLLQMVRSDLPFGPVAVAKAGIYDAEMNRHGALSVRDCNGDLLGVKPGEFEFVGEIPSTKFERSNTMKNALLGAIFTVVLLALLAASGGYNIIWENELKSPEAQKAIGDYIQTHCTLRTDSSGAVTVFPVCFHDDPKITSEKK